MAISTAICTSFKQQMLAGTQVIASDTFKLALYTSTANLSSSTTAYTATGECSGTNYTAGGNTLTGANVWTDGVTVGIDFNDITFTNITVSDIRGFMIYNSSRANAAVMVFDFGSSASVTTSDYTLVFPTPNTASGLLKFL